MPNLKEIISGLPVYMVVTFPLALFLMTYISPELFKFLENERLKSFYTLVDYLVFVSFFTLVATIAFYLNVGLLFWVMAFFWVVRCSLQRLIAYRKNKIPARN